MVRQFNTGIFLMVVSVLLFTCRFLVIEGDHLLSHWFKVGRKGSSKTEPMRKTAISIDTSPARTDTS